MTKLWKEYNIGQDIIKALLPIFQHTNQNSVKYPQNIFSVNMSNVCMCEMCGVNAYNWNNQAHHSLGA